MEVAGSGMINGRAEDFACPRRTRTAPTPIGAANQAHSIWQQTSPNTSQCSFNPCLKETVSSLAPKRNAKDSNLLLRLSRIIFCLWFTHVRHNVVDDVVRFSFLTIISRHRSETNCVFLPQQKNLKKI